MLLESRLRSTPRMYREHSEHASTSQNQCKAVSWQEVEELECPLAALQVPEAFSMLRSEAMCHLEDPATSVKDCPLCLVSLQCIWDMCINSF